MLSTTFLTLLPPIFAFPVGRSLASQICLYLIWYSARQEVAGNFFFFFLSSVWTIFLRVPIHSRCWATLVCEWLYQLDSFGDFWFLSEILALLLNANGSLLRRSCTFSVYSSIIWIVIVYKTAHLQIEVCFAVCVAVVCSNLIEMFFFSIFIYFFSLTCF